jgi:hypothetical protein
MDPVEIGWGSMHCDGLAQDTDKWRAILNVVINFPFRKMLGKYPVAVQLLGSRVVLNSTELVILLETASTLR